MCTIETSFLTHSLFTLWHCGMKRLEMGLIYVNHEISCVQMAQLDFSQLF